ncbi:hypothetical protein [Dinoroseobacter sp. S76]|uniref:hypothetical protein n=1 Tax=Dinoroseobacter sp. S76 TaxID=3415124 RepID=UPI003C7AAB01
MKLSPKAIDVWRAGANWLSWKPDFECGSENELPVLLDESRFRKFWKEYSVLQGEESLARERIRVHLAGFKSQSDPEKYAEDLKEALKLQKKHMSFISKLSAFRDPENYIASDSFNREALKRLGVRKWSTYEALLDFAQREAQGDMLSDLLERTLPAEKPFSAGFEKAFRLRVVDCFLMRTGGR